MGRFADWRQRVGPATRVGSGQLHFDDSPCTTATEACFKGGDNKVPVSGEPVLPKVSANRALSRLLALVSLTDWYTRSLTSQGSQQIAAPAMSCQRSPLGCTFP